MNVLNCILLRQVAHSQRLARALTIRDSDGNDLPVWRARLELLARYYPDRDLNCHLRHCLCHGHGGCRYNLHRVCHSDYS